MDRRNMMLMTGMTALAAALPVSAARADVPRPNSPVVPAPAQPPGGAVPGAYLFQDEFDGPHGAGPDPAKWVVQNWRDDVIPPIDGIYRNDRRNVFLDGNSNLVLLATQEGSTYYSGKVITNFRGMIGTTWEARIKLDCLFPGLWPAFWLVNEDPLPDGEVDILEWYGNMSWPPGTTVHAASNGKTWEGRSIPQLVDGNWHTWRVHWGHDGFQFWRDYVDGAKPYFTVPPEPIKIHGRDEWRWPFNNPGYWMHGILNLAVGGSGGGDPRGAPYPSAMLIDYFRVW